VALPLLVVDVAEVGRDVVWRKAFKLAISPRGRCRDRDMPALEAEGVDSMLKLASSSRMAINEREMMLQIQLTAVMGRELEAGEAGEAEIESGNRSKAYKILQLEEVLVILSYLSRTRLQQAGPSFCFLLFLPRLLRHLSAANFGPLYFPAIRGE